jgi:UDP-N-acetylmuramoyl-tripeptide--D-alanyl-D-alanine ligase
MRPLSLQFIAAAAGGTLLAGLPGQLVNRVQTDSRAVQPGDLFVALEGEKFDGHAFLGDVIARGAAAVLVRADKVPADVHGSGVITVSSPRQALGGIAAAYRKEFSIPIIAVAGSNGKTTTKELIASVLRRRFETLWSAASFNNDIGVPLTLLRIDPSHQVAVAEVGTNHPGEMAPLVKMIAPQFGVLTSIGREHLEFFGDLEGVAKEEGTLAELLPATGRLFINGDCPETDAIAARSKAPVVRVGLRRDNAWRGSNIRMSDSGLVFRLTAPESRFDGDYQISLLGRHQVVNALFAIALGAHLGLEPEEARQGLSSCQPPKMRLQLTSVREVRLLDDAYNANADSMRAALETLRDFPCSGRRVAVLGDMAELGAHGTEAHAEVGRRAAEMGVGQLFAVGRMAPVMSEAARSAGLGNVREFADVESAGAVIREFVRPGDVVLLKASRAARLERIGELLRNDPVSKS